MIAMEPYMIIHGDSIRAIKDMDIGDKHFLLTSLEL